MPSQRVCLCPLDDGTQKRGADVPRFHFKLEIFKMSQKPCDSLLTREKNEAGSYNTQNLINKWLITCHNKRVGCTYT